MDEWWEQFRGYEFRAEWFPTIRAMQLMLHCSRCGNLIYPFGNKELADEMEMVALRIAQHNCR